MVRFGEKTQSNGAEMWVTLRTVLHEAVRVRIGRHRRAGRQIQLRQNIADVAIHGALAERKRLSNRAIGLSGGHEGDDLPLSAGQAASRRTRQ